MKKWADTVPSLRWTNIYRRSSICRFDLSWDIRILSLQDSDWNIQALLKGCKYGYAAGEGALIDYFYNVNNSGISGCLSISSHFKSHLILLEKIINSMSIRQLLYYSDELKMYYLWVLKKNSIYRVDFMEYVWGKWFICHPWFFIRLFLSYRLYWKFERFFFPILYTKELQNQKKHIQMIKSLLSIQERGNKNVYR